jgi:hypothetical protein
MAIGGKLEDGCAGRLLSAAALLDLLFVTFLVRLSQGYHAEFISMVSLPRATRVELIWGVAFLVVLGLYWTIVEFFLNGQSLGRFALGLHLRARDGQPLPKTKRINRGIRKLGCMGLLGLSPTEMPVYDRACDAVWFSRIVPRANRPLNEWRLIIDAPNYPRKGYVLGNLPGFKQHKAVKIGRDPKWANLVLPASLTQVSGSHCVLMLRNGELVLRDWGESGKGSRNGTILNGRQLRPEEWAHLGNADHFRLADVRIRLER